MRLNIQAQIDIQSSIELDNDDIPFLLKHQKNVENTIKNMVYNAFGGDYVGEDGFQKISLKIFQNQLTSVGEPAIMNTSKEREEHKNVKTKKKPNKKCKTNGGQKNENFT